MLSHLQAQLRPLSLAGVLTWAGVALSFRGSDALAWGLLVAYLFAFMLQVASEGRRARWCDVVLLLQGIVALALIARDPERGFAPVLLVIWTAQLAMAWPLRAWLPTVLAADGVFYAIARNAGFEAPGLLLVIYLGFQAFATMCAHYARSAESARDRLALVNADLLATRALLADSARDAERLRVARELHDVAGHTLTALTLNLRALAAEPALAQRAEVQMSQQLAGELMRDLRGVVQALRDARGLDLATALRALAAPLPRPRLELQLDETVQVTDSTLAETLLRLVQEALTNSARHAEATTVRVALRREGDQLLLSIEDDGRVRGPLREGHGLAGMRERVAALGGELRWQVTPQGALRLDASLPA